MKSNTSFHPLVERFKGGCCKKMADKNVGPQLPPHMQKQAEENKSENIDKRDKVIFICFYYLSLFLRFQAKGGSLKIVL